MGASNVFLSFFIGIVITSTLSSIPKTDFEIKGRSTTHSTQDFLIPLVENVVDSRFKLLAADFQDQINDLKGKVVVLEVSKTANVGLFEHHHEINKRQTNVAKPNRPYCENSSSLCTFFYPDHPDAGRKKGNYSSNVTNEMLQDPNKVKGLPSSCKDLQLLGHKLNGLYLVKTSQPNQAIKIETVFCNFTSVLNVSQSFIGNVDLKTKSVHFYVQRNSHFNTPGSIIPFELARLNEGDAFSLSTGIFTAPVKGIYHFQFSAVKSLPYKYLDIFLQVNGTNIALAYTHQPYSGSSDPIFLSASLRLAASDRVNLFNSGEGGFHDNTDHFTHFSGWLVEEYLM